MSKFPKAIIGIKCSKMLPGEVGVFALRNLKKGTIYGRADYGGEKMFSKKVYKSLDKITQKRVHDFCGMYDDGFISIPDVNYMPIHYHCNHSCEPNAGFKNDNMVLIKDVNAGEEILLDCAFSTTDPDFVLHCKCGSKKCRKIITGNDWKNPEYFKKNKKYMSI